jgi:integrase
METTRHFLFENKVQLYMRPNSPHWQCSCSFAGKQKRATTGEESLARAKDVARDWYLNLLGKYHAGQLKDGKKFKEAAARFIDEFETITYGQRSPIYVAGHKFRIKNHLNPFFGEMVLSDITAGKVQDYRIHRMKTGVARVDQLRAGAKKFLPSAPKPKTDEKPRPPARSTLHQEIVCLRQILKVANRHGWIDHLPNLSPAYQVSTKITHRGWFSPEEYKVLYEATRKRADNPPRKRWRWECEQLHDFVLFMANTGLRPDEALRLEFRDVEVERDEATKQTILVIKVRGKRGVGYCKSMPNAVFPFERLRKRKRRKAIAPEQAHPDGEAKANAKPIVVTEAPGPADRLFPKTHRDLFNEILDELDLKTDREGNRRTAYSLRHTYISLRLMEGADIYQIAKNCRTSVEMIEKYYASHIKNMLDAAAINVRRPKPRKAPVRERVEELV